VTNSNVIKKPSASDHSSFKTNTLNGNLFDFEPKVEKPIIKPVIEPVIKPVLEPIIKPVTPPASPQELRKPMGFGGFANYSTSGMKVPGSARPVIPVIPDR